MAPTLIDLDGFAHLTKQAAQAGSGFGGTYDTVTDTGNVITFDQVNKRHPLNVAAAKMAGDGTNATALGRTLAASTRVYVGSYYFRLSAAPSSGTNIFVAIGQTGATNIKVNTDGTLLAVVGGGTSATTKGAYNDGKWHLMDVKLDYSANPITMDYKVDGIAQTQVTSAQAAVDISGVRIGTTTASATLTAWYADWVSSATSGDYPIGHHLVVPVYINGEGTDVLGSTNAIQNDSGGQSNLFQKIQDWNNGGTPDTSGYITYASTTTGDAASNFAEFTLASIPSNYVIWDVKGYIAGFASGTTADNADLQVLTAHGGTLIDHVGNLIDYSGSTSVLGYHQKTLARISGGWTPSNLGSCVAQWGRSTDTNPLPRLSAVMFEIAIQHLPIQDTGNFPLA